MQTFVWLISLKSLGDDARAIQLGEVARLKLAPGQDAFVGDPLKMALIGLEDESRVPYIVESDGRAVGVLTLQYGAATLAGWADDDDAWLLRGFLIGRQDQGRGLGTPAAAAAVREAEKLSLRLGGAQTGVVLSVNEGNPAGKAAYRKAGFEDRGEYLGGDKGPQRIMYRSFNR